MKQKVMLDLFASPGTLIPIVAGISSLLFSWAIGGSASANAVGILGIIGGVGHFASRLVLGLEDMTQRAYEAIQQHDERQRTEMLDQLERDLRDDEDRRTDLCLRRLRTIFDDFRSTCHEHHLTAKHPQLVDQIHQIFGASVVQLQHSRHLYRESERSGPSQQAIYLQQREQVIQEVVETINHMEDTINQFRLITLQPKNKVDLGQLREELDETLQVARRTQERMAQMADPESRSPDLT